MAEFCERVRALREERKWSQKALAQELKLTLNAYQLYEYGQGYPTYKRLLALADLFDVSLDYLVGRSDIRERR
ncbi:helix-turn-helix transcriptional regulator [uncultured Intestinimonas sp.]|uniref:helix-turn-helix domain-containing protein n=1 Tax=uncultured Intestinimonas sp. TaxID=1689265 RepID=UPI0025FAE976|nr:helix-turn-helix transcriptional regulator [uncultured Intestinimonas sp.]